MSVSLRSSTRAALLVAVLAQVSACLKTRYFDDGGADGGAGSNCRCRSGSIAALSALDHFKTKLTPTMTAESMDSMKKTRSSL